uniref:COP9 signalosome complex subunit 6 n=1 Tax=Hirondellea gigas TaxID=1518452 RepID=A0A6A7G6W6_9CRUS
MAVKLDVRLHPLVILNIADHHARRNVEDDTKDEHVRVIGAIFGVQTGRTVEIVNSFEITFKYLNPTEIEIKEDFLKADTELYKKVYPHHECLGWYTTASEVSETDYLLHKKFMDFNESPLLLMLNPELKYGAKELPINIFESEVHMVNDVPKVEFVDVGFAVITEEAERITVDHVVKVVDDDATASVVTPRFMGIRESVLSLKQRLQILHRYLCDVKAGKVPADQTILRAIKTVCNRLPTMDSPKFKHDFLREYTDALLITYLASMTKGTHQMNQLVEKFSLAYERPVRAGRDFF